MGDGIKSMAGKAWDGIKAFGNRTLRGFGKIINGFTQQGINWILGKIGVDTKIPKWEVPQYANGTGGHPGARQFSVMVEVQMLDQKLLSPLRVTWG